MSGGSSRFLQKTGPRHAGRLITSSDSGLRVSALRIQSLETEDSGTQEFCVQAIWVDSGKIWVQGMRIRSKALTGRG